MQVDPKSNAKILIKNTFRREGGNTITEVEIGVILTQVKVYGQTLEAVKGEKQIPFYTL